MSAPDSQKIVETVLGRRLAPEDVARFEALATACGIPPSDPLFGIVVMMQATTTAQQATTAAQESMPTRIEALIEKAKAAATGADRSTWDRLMDALNAASMTGIMIVGLLLAGSAIGGWAAVLSVTRSSVETAGYISSTVPLADWMRTGGYRGRTEVEWRQILGLIQRQDHCARDPATCGR